MFDRIKRALSRDSSAQPETAAPSQLGGAASEWAATQGFGFSSQASGSKLQFEGKVGSKRWRMEVGKPSRKFIRGEELRARAELGIDEDTAVLLMNRPLKEVLEKQAYALYTDSLQTTADPNLPEEMRWLAMYTEVGWESLPRPFWQRYSVLTDARENALAWIDPELADLLMDWPEPGLEPERPFMLMLLRGKAYLRMEYTPADMATLQHACAIFTHACGTALNGPGAHISI